MSDGRLISMKDTCPGGIKTTLMRHAKNVYRRTWAKKHDIEELKEGVWFEPIKAVLKRTVNHTWTARRAAQARSCVMSGAWTQKKAKRHELCAESKHCKCCEAEGTENTGYTIARGGDRKETTCQML